MMTRILARLAFSVFLILGMGGAFAEDAVTPKRGGVLHVTHRDNPPSASIHEEATISTVMPFSGVYNNLIVFDPAGGQDRFDRVLPELATAWSWSEDGRTLTFKLRGDVKWHDGKPFSSADVKCTWDMIQGKGDSSFRKNPRKSWYFNLREVTTNGPQEVAFHLADPQPSLMAMLAGGMSPVYPCHVPAAQMRTQPIGTGPFMFGELKQNESMRIVRNPTYWKPGRPYLDAVEFTIIPNRSTSQLAFTSGKMDLTFSTEVTPVLMKDVLANDPTAICDLLPTNTQANLMVNRDKPPFNDAKVRSAMALSFDRASFITILSQGADKIGGSMLPPPQGLWGMSPEFLQTVAGYSPDVEKSRETGRRIMRELGYGPQNTLKIKVSTRNIPSYRDPAVLLIDNLKNIYIDGELEVLDTSVWYARLLRKDFTVALNVQGMGVDDPDVMFFESFACDSERNYTNYCNRDIEALFHQQSQMSDLEKRRALVWEIDKKLQEDGARPVISHGWAATCFQKYVKGVALASNSIYNHWRFEDVWRDK